ncbi:urea ABC transporter ATP-binding subunit UrtE [Pyruvatibacter sp. HU-CL02332]|uniref:urea ABC transporter ATP-binding subunit UrtE n=1 Tax=Pyruvatibacter sp. HU-CL02332 TaxID=3127650 RepID=UPI00310A5F11
MLNISRLNLSYGAAQILWDVDLSAEAGKVTCVMGRNGVGKTTLLRGIVGQQRVKSGTITLRGKKISNATASARARMGIAYVPQGREIFPLLTVKENLEIAFATGRNTTVSEDVFELFPVLKSMLSRRGGDLSGGQQQQLAIARAMVMGPDVMVLDEPTEGIQPSVIKDIGRAITYLRDEQNMAILLVEQYFDFAQELADTFIVLDRGRVVASGVQDDMGTESVRKLLTV